MKYTNLNRVRIMFKNDEGTLISPKELFEQIEKHLDKRHNDDINSPSYNQRYLNSWAKSVVIEYMVKYMHRVSLQELS